MNYWALNVIFLGIVLVVLLLAGVVVARRRRAAARGVPGPVRRRRILGALGITMALLLGLTAAFDNVMISIGLVGYDPDLISGAFVGIAPLEDFAYAIAAVLLLPSLWLLLERRDT